MLLRDSFQIAEYNQDTCHFAFFILDNGQYQINIYTQDGKLYEILADNIEFQNPEMRQAQ